MSTKISPDSRLSADLESNTLSRCLRVVDGLRTSLDISTDPVIVARSESVEVVETMNSHGILRSIATTSSGVSSNLAFGDVICGLSTEQEVVTAEDGVSGEGRLSVPCRVSRT